MKPYLAPSLVRLTRERDVRWYSLRKRVRPALEGWLGDAAHQARSSGHNPDTKGCVHAKDFDIDGMNVPEFLARVIGDPRVWYVVHDQLIWNRRTAWVPEAYTGPNPHLEHVHVSLINSTEKRVWSAQELYFAETTTTGWGLASLIIKSMYVRVVARIKRRGY